MPRVERHWALTVDVIIQDNDATLMMGMDNRKNSKKMNNRCECYEHAYSRAP